MKYRTVIVSMSVIFGVTVISLAPGAVRTASAQEYVHGYYRSNGTYVAPYYRSEPDGTVTDNYSYEGNVNPYTGEVGTNRYTHDETSPYYDGPDSDGDSGHDGDDDGDDDGDN